MRARVKFRARTRDGKGFSLGELEEAGLMVAKARKMGMRVDTRRRTSHAENIREIKKQASTIEKEVEKKAKKKIKKKAIGIGEVKGIGPKRVKELNKLKINTAQDLLKADLKKVSGKSGIPLKTLERYALQVKKMI